MAAEAKGQKGNAVKIDLRAYSKTERGNSVCEKNRM